MTHPYRLDSSSEKSAASASSLATTVLARFASEVDAGGRFPTEGVDALANAGLLGLTVPIENGGRGQGMRAFAAVTEELAGACASTAMIYVMHVSATMAIDSGQHLAQREPLLEDIAKGKHLTTLA